MIFFVLNLFCHVFFINSCCSTFSSHALSVLFWKPGALPRARPHHQRHHRRFICRLLLHLLSEISRLNRGLLLPP